MSKDETRLHLIPPTPDWALGKRNQNPEGIGFWSLLAEDFVTHDRDLFQQGLWAVALHRFGNMRMSVRPKLLRLPFSLVYKFLFKCVECSCGISLPYNVPLGRRVHIWHHSGIILSARSIGDDVQIRQNTTMGVVRTKHNFELPVIEDRVDIGVGAVILGGITVGHDSAIGANAVVLCDVPPHCLAVGVPALIKPRKGVSKRD